MAVWAMSTHAGQRAESLDWYKVYEWTNFSDNAFFSYTINNASTAPAFTRILYQILLNEHSLWVEFDDFTGGVASRIGVPFTWVYDTQITNLIINYSSNSTSFPGTTPSTVYNRSAATGRLNFWPSNYAPLGGSNYDETDTAYSAGDGYASLQIFDTTVSPAICIFAWNNWGAGDFGFGNPLGSATTDWTFANNHPTFRQRLGRVYVK
jgi:hypothetical protein